MGTGPWRVPDALLSPNPPTQIRRMRYTVVSGEIEAVQFGDDEPRESSFPKPYLATARAEGATLHILYILFVPHGLGIPAISPEA